jgi:hypothetical protein
MVAKTIRFRDNTVTPHFVAARYTAKGSIAEGLEGLRTLL